MDEKSVLSKLYTGTNPAAYSTAKNLHKAARNVSMKKVRDFISKRPSSRIKTKRSVKDRRIFAFRKPLDVIMADLAFFPKFGRYTALLCICDAFTRKILALSPLPNKNSKTVAREFEKILSELKIKRLLTDLGSEFFGETQKVLKKYEVDHYFSNPNHEAHVAIIERLFRTIKLRIKRMMLDRKTDNWPSLLGFVMDLYNNTHSRALGMSPNQAMLQKNWSEVWYNTFERKEGHMIARNSRRNFKFSLGDVVRLQLFKRNKFQKESEPLFSEFAYEIVERKREASVPMYKLSELLTSQNVDGYLYENELQKYALNKDKIRKIHAIYDSKIKNQQVEVKVSYPNYPNKKEWITYSSLLGL